MKAELADFKSLKDLKPMLSSRPPCLSIYMALDATPPNQSAKANALRWRECLRSLEPKIEQNGSEARELLKSISDWDTIWGEEKQTGKSIAVFRSPDFFCVTSLAEPVKGKAVLGPHFCVRPLLPELTKDGTFYILALSQKDVRVLRCTSSSSEEIPLPASVPRSFDAFMNNVKPDHVLDNRGTPGPGAGSSKGIMFSTSTDKEDKDEYLAHFYKQIDRGLNEMLRGKAEPVVPVGVEYELALYRSLNTYPHLAEEAVQGAPNSLKAGEMHARALDALSRQYGKKVDDALAEYNHKVGGGASNRLKDIIPAAHDGRVLTLLVSDSLETTGSFDEATYTVKGRETGTSGDEDLVNDAVVQTILHAGHVFVVPNSKMPNGAPLSAIFRF
jgi:Bacterial archaeo-eukaryotic release factor family 3